MELQGALFQDNANLRPKSRLSGFQLGEEVAPLLSPLWLEQILQQQPSRGLRQTESVVDDLRNDRIRIAK